MIFEKAGFFSELRHGVSQGPSLLAAQHAMSAHEKLPEIVRYLRSGRVIAVTGVAVGDWFDPAPPSDIELALLTDGLWVWPSDFSM